MPANLPVKARSGVETDLHENVLLEFLYTYFGIDQLYELLNEGPHASMLKMWDVTRDEFKLNVQAAIDMVAAD